MENKKFIDMIGQEVNVGDIVVIPHSTDGLSQNIGMVTELKYLTKAGKPRKEADMIWKSVGGRKYDWKTKITTTYFLTEIDGYESTSRHSTVAGYCVNITKLLTPEQQSMKLLLQVT